MYVNPCIYFISQKSCKCYSRLKPTIVQNSLWNPTCNLTCKLIGSPCKPMRDTSMLCFMVLGEPWWVLIRKKKDLLVLVVYRMFDTSAGTSLESNLVCPRCSPAWPWFTLLLTNTWHSKLRTECVHWLVVFVTLMGDNLTELRRRQKWCSDRGHFCPTCWCQMYWDIGCECCMFLGSESFTMIHNWIE